MRYLSICLLLVFFPTTIYSDLDQTKYKDLSELMYSYLVILDENGCDVSYDLEAKNQKVGFTMDCTEREDLIKKNKAAYFDLIKKYSDFINSQNDSIWRDDAYLCLILFNLTASMPVSDFGPIAWEEIDHFLNTFDDLRIEPWTKNKFYKLGSFRLFFDKAAWGDKVPEDINRLLEKGDYISLLILSELNLLMLYERQEEAVTLLSRRKKHLNDITTKIIKSRLDSHPWDY